MARMVKCIKLGQESEGLDFPPYPGELGKRIYDNVSKTAEPRRQKSARISGATNGQAFFR